jgi:uncharacterized Rmd1/YagE family protein
MRYITAYETTDRFDFYRVVEWLERNNIEFEILHEYRLHAETNFGTEGEPAILRVKEKDISKVDKLLMEGGFLKYAGNESRNGMKVNSNLDVDLSRDEIQEIEGNKIKKVFYVLANEIDFDLDSIHSVDFGIVIQFENGKCLSWKFEEEDVDFENDIFIPHRYELKFFDFLGDVDRSFKIEDVSQNEYWAQLMRKPIISIRVYTQEL